MPPEKDNETTTALPVVLQARIAPSLLLLCLALIAVGMAAASTDRYIEIAMIGVMAGVIGMLQHFPGLSTLTLDDKGFVVKTVFGSRFIAWREASNFRSIRKRRTDLVTWDDGGGNPYPSRSRAQIFAYWKPYDAATLAAVMNQIRRQNMEPL
jgi:hypothetical protein